MNEIKFIITKDRRHFKSNFYDHSIIAIKNDYKPGDILETGLIIDHKIIILECYNPLHLEKIKHTKFIEDDVNLYIKILEARRLSSLYCYGITKEGD